MRFENLDSMMPPDVQTVERISAVSGHSLSALRRVPVFWVGEALMDQLYDPWRTVLLDPECVEEALEGAGEKLDPEMHGEAFIRDLDRFWERLAECPGKVSTEYRPAMGVYIRDLDEAAVEHIAGARGTAGAAISAGMPAVFVCPERCATEVEGVSTSLNASRALECVVAQVAFHELTHAWLDTDMARYRTSWGRLIEESLCEAESSLLFPEEERAERALVNRILIAGPVEYRCFRFWNGPGRMMRRYARRGYQDVECALDVWKRCSYGMLFDDVADYDATGLACSLFGGDFGELARARSSLPRARLVEIFWKQVARRILVWMHDEED